jgi:hypothetical protein
MASVTKAQNNLQEIDASQAPLAPLPALTNDAPSHEAESILARDVT